MIVYRPCHPHLLGLVLAAAISASTAGADPRPAITWFPDAALYPAYNADPRQPRFALRLLSMTRRAIPHTPRARLATAVGRELAALRLHPVGAPERGFELTLAAGFFAQWEERGRDGIGWDGIYRVNGAWKPSAALAFKLGLHHVSSHVVDEYIENTGRRRIGYTREEIAIGAGWFGRLRVYGEIGYAHLMRSALQEPWRLQAGLEYEAAKYYAAVDAQTHQENDWENSLAVAAGLRWPLRHPGQALRIGLEYYRGRSPLGEFFQAQENQLGLGCWLDL